MKNLENSIAEITRNASLKKETDSKLTHEKLLELFKFKEVIPAYEYMVQFYSGKIRKDGITPASFHPLECAFLLNRYGCEPETVAAALLHDVLEDPFKDRLKGILNEIIYNSLLYQNTEQKMDELRALSVPDQNTELNIILTEIFEKQDFAKQVAGIVTWVSDLYYLPIEKTDFLGSICKSHGFDVKRYTDYLGRLIDFTAKSQDLRPLNLKLGDRTNNTKTLYNINPNTIRNALLKNNILLEEIEKHPSLKINHTTYDIFRNLEYEIQRHKDTPQIENLSPNERSEFNLLAEESTKIIENIKRKYKSK